MKTILLLSFIIGFSPSQDIQQQLSSQDLASWEARIAADGTHLLDAGNSGHKELIPILRKHLSAARTVDPDRRNTRMALAKLGDEPQLQAIACDIRAGSQLEMQRAALEEISYVGGWYSVQIYRELLTPAAEARFLKAKRSKNSDMTFVSPRWWGLISLPKVVPNPPLPSIDAGSSAEQIEQYTKNWTSWIQEHEDILKALQPKGEHVDLSGRSCKSTKKM
ncbi:MAG TPA: hypothetical protein VHV32_16630 [Candidatus Angelobacter sp.]|jgi:hypothetical protein|nr:hypothetical protein [Candidatus Angelobacter sp.]